MRSRLGITIFALTLCLVGCKTANQATDHLQSEVSTVTYDEYVEYAEEDTDEIKKLSCDLTSLYSQYDINNPRRNVICIIMNNDEQVHELEDILNIKLPQVDFDKKCLLITTGYSVNRVVFNSDHKNICLDRVSIDGSYENDTLYCYLLNPCGNLTIQNPYIQKKGLF